VDHLLAYGAVSAADGDILQRTAEAARGVPFEMRQHHHRVIIKHVFSDRHSLEMFPALHGDHHRAVLVHDVYRAEIPVVDPDGFAMIRRSISLAYIQGIGVHQVAVGNMLLQAFYHFPPQYIGAMRLTGVQLDPYFAGHALIDLGIDSQQSVDTDILRKKYLGFVLSCNNSAPYAFKIA